MLRGVDWSIVDPFEFEFETEHCEQAIISKVNDSQVWC